MAKELSIEARKRSDDPAQERIREEKAKWNENKKLFIAQVIAFGRGFNGRGDPRAGLPPSDIKYPFPSEISQYLEDMTRRFEGLAQSAKHIMDMQSEYSKNRRKSKKDIASVDYFIEKQAASKFSRLWAWITQYPWFRDDQSTKNRLSLLYSLADFRDQVNDIEYILTSSDDNAISESFYLWMKFSELFDIRFVLKLNNSLDYHLEEFKNKSRSGEVGPPPKKTDKAKGEKEEVYIKDELFGNIEDSIIKIQNDLDQSLMAMAKIKTLIDLGKVKPLTTEDTVNTFYKNTSQLLFKTFLLIKNKASREDIQKSYDALTESYSNFMKELSKIAGLDVAQVSVSGLIGNLERMEASSYYNPVLQKLAKKDIRRWLHRLRLKFHFGELNRFKADIARKLNHLSHLMNSAQDLLQDNNTVIVDILEIVSDIYNTTSDICYDFSVMGRYNNAIVGERKSKKKKYEGSKIPINDINLLERLMHKFKNYKDFLDSKVKQ